MQINTNQPPLSRVTENLMYAASLCISQGKTEDAILLYDKVLALMPDYAKAYYERGRARHLAGDLLGASNDLKRAFQLSPELEKEIYSLKHELIGVQMKLDAQMEKNEK